MKRGFLVVLKHSVTHFHFRCSSIKSFPSFIPHFLPKYLSLSLSLSLSLIVDEHTNTHLPHSYLSYKSTTIHALTWIQITPNSSFSFSKQHTQSPSLPLPKQSFLLSILKINLFLPSLSFISLNSRMWLNEWHSLIPHPSHITLHRSSLSHGEWIISSVLMLCELGWEVVMMCLMRDENEIEREVIVMKDDVDEMNNTCVVFVVGKHDWCDVVVWMREMER